MDLCCAPGVKMLLMSEMVKRNFGSVTGVDCENFRLQVTRNMLRKYKGKQCRLFCCDGVQFEHLAPPEFGEGVMLDELNGRNGAPSKKRFLNPDGNLVDLAASPILRDAYPNSKIARKHLYDLSDLIWSDSYMLRTNSFSLYDRVLIDAECSTSGAIRHHITKAKAEENLREEEKKRGIVRTYRSKEEIDKIVALQKNLIMRGWQ